MTTRKTQTKRQRRAYEAPDMAAFVTRTMRAMVRRAEAGDLEVMSALQSIRDAVDAAMVDAAEGLRTPDANGHAYSWTDLGRELGVTRQTAQQRFGTRRPAAAAVDPGQATIDDLLA